MTSNPKSASVPAAPDAHPVLIETTRTYLVWIEADTPAAARRVAEKDPLRFLAELGELDGTEVDASTDMTVLSEDVSAWLDLQPEQYQRLDDYFGADTAGQAAA